MRRLLTVSGLACLATGAHAQQPPRMVAAHATDQIVLPEALAPSVPEPAGRAAYRRILEREAASAGLPAAIADAVAQIESGYDPAAVGSVGEIGLMQVRPATAAMLGFRGSPADLAEPAVNIRYGVRYLAEAWRLSNGDLCQALMKYRAGHGAQTMSPLSATYCARAQAILKRPEDLRVAQGTARPVPHAANRTSLPKGLKRGTPEFERAFWAAHEARIAGLRAKVQAIWRVRGANAG